MLQQSYKEVLWEFWGGVVSSEVLEGARIGKNLEKVAMELGPKCDRNCRCTYRKCGRSTRRANMEKVKTMELWEIPWHHIIDSSSIFWWEPYVWNLHPSEDVEHHKIGVYILSKIPFLRYKSTSQSPLWLSSFHSDFPITLHTFHRWFPGCIQLGHVGYIPAHLLQSL